MEPQENQKFDISKVPDLKSDWVGTASKDVWAPESASSADSEFTSFKVHKGAKFVAGEGSIVSTDAEEKPEPPQEYTTRYRTTYLKAGPVLFPYETKVREPIEREAKPFLYNAEVEAKSGSKVLAESAAVTARMGSFVQAGRGGRVEALEGSLVRAQSGSSVQAHDGSRVLAEDESYVTARSGSRVVALDASQVRAEPGSNIEAREGSTITICRTPGDQSTAQRILKTEKGSSIVVLDPSIKIDPDLEGNIRFAGNKQEWETFRANNPDLKLPEPDYTSLVDIIEGNTIAIKSAQEAARRDTTPVTPKGLEVPPSPVSGNTDSLERALNRSREIRRRLGVK